MSSPQLSNSEMHNGTRNALIDATMESGAVHHGDLTPALTLIAKPSQKQVNGEPYLDVPLQNAFRSSQDTLSNLSDYSADNETERSTGRTLHGHPTHRLSSHSPAPPKTWRGEWHSFWQRNRGLIYVFTAQFFGALMNIMTSILETQGTHGHQMHPLQVGNQKERVPKRS